MRRVLLAAACLIATAGAAEPPPPKVDCTKDYETLYSIAYNAPDVAYVQTPEKEEVWSASRLDTYIFTREGQKPYPSIILRSIRQVGKKKWSASMSGCSWGDQAAFAQMLKDYKRINGKLLDDLKAGRPIGPP